MLAPETFKNPNNCINQNSEKDMVGNSENILEINEKARLLKVRKKCIIDQLFENRKDAYLENYSFLPLISLKHFRGKELLKAASKSPTN